MKGEDAAKRVAGQLPTRFLRGYAAAKLRSDPVYDAVVSRLRGSTQALFDLGCGTGILEIYLRELGFSMPISGIDHDERKITIAASIAARYTGLQFRVADAREPVPRGMNVVALDVLHYFRDEEQSRIVESIASAIPEGGMAIIRDAVRDGSLRYRLTAAQETFSRVIRWLRAERLNFPTRDAVAEPFRRRGFSEEIIPLWGRTPFNNYLFVFSRAGSGTVKV